jgi:amino-acid N-acetyltransferase
MDIKIRKATSSDVKEIKKILSYYYLDTETVDKNLPEFIVAVRNEKIVGCACLDISDIVELRSIAILPNYRNKGIGSKLVDTILTRAAELTGTVYLRTTSPAFFEKKGFRRLKDEEKKAIWKDCAECDKLDVCKQTLMRLDIKSKKNYSGQVG